MIDEFLAKLDQAGDLGIVWKGRPRAGCPVPRALSSEGTHRHGPVDDDAATAGCTATERRAGCCGMAKLLRVRSRALRCLPQDRRGTALPGGCGGNCARRPISIAGVSCRQQIEHFTDRRDQAHRRGPGGADRPAIPGSSRPEPVPAEVAPTPESVAHARTLAPVPVAGAPALMLAAIGGEYHRLSIVEHGWLSQGGSKRKSTRILVVEDEPSIAGFVRRGLHFEGYDVDVVPDGPGASAASAKARPISWCST